MIANQHSEDDEGEYTDDLIRLKSQILAMHELLDVADVNVIEQATKMESLNAELVVAKEMLEVQREDTFAYLAHDINNQLVGQRMVLECLRDMRLDSGQADIVNTLVKSNQRILQLIKNLLKVNEFSQPQHRYLFQRNDLRLICLAATKKLDPVVSTTGVLIKSEFEDELPPVLMDEKAFTQALVTLLQNALRNSSKGQSVRMNVFRCGKGVTISISDSGAGTKFTNINHLFERFWQEESLLSLHEDLAFELFIASQIVKAHNGRIAYEGSPETGTTIKLTIEQEYSR